ncbi:MAG: bifunctional demethylmenaquinone methyltransferase/2-methoxy-6-polyprenyl-1,4-benzoquinol methylase UbiE [Bacteroidales bacterium]|nr:bifunctional demethylmenaquinone methyltransferase/2-methoxy-6-polyprenyl-1,4-benzoquinol methylase UbiE [Bacteroidales bacterium]
MTTRKNISGNKPQNKERAAIAQMFNKIAWRYDFLNHFFSFHIDKIWRRKAVNELCGRQLDKVLDVATGTADLALAIQKRLHPGHITGVDISEGMLTVGRQKIEKTGLEQQISLEYGDSAALPFNDLTFDAATVAFGVRNFEHLEKGLGEMFRVLKTGGKVVILEFSIPQNRIFRSIFHFYFFRILPFVGRLVSKDAHAYNYLPDSVQSFPHGAEFKSKMESCGFSGVTVRPLTFGIASIYAGIKQNT